MLSDHKIKDKRYHLTYTLSDFHKNYKKEYPGQLDRDTYINVIKGFFAGVKDEVINNRFWFKMPHRLGTIKIVKRKNWSDLNAHRIDWHTTKKTGKLVYHLNRHTDRHYFKFMWEKPKTGIRVKHAKYFSFKPVRWATRQLGERIRACATDPTLKDYDCLE